MKEQRAAGRIARAAGCRRLLLTHFYPETEAAEDPVAAAREEFSGEVIGARDQDVFEV